MPFLGHQHDGLDVSPDNTPTAVEPEVDANSRARMTVQRFASDATDEAMLLDLLGLAD